MTVAYLVKTLLQRVIHGAPVAYGWLLLGIVTQMDIVSAIDRGVPMNELIAEYRGPQCCYHPRRYAAVRGYPQVQEAGYQVMRVIVIQRRKADWHSLSRCFPPFEQPVLFKTDIYFRYQ